MDIDFEKKQSIITKYNIDPSTKLPVSIPVTESQQVHPLKNLIQMTGIPKKNKKIQILSNDMIPVKRPEQITKAYHYYVDYDQGIIHFHPDAAGNTVEFKYEDIGVTLVSANKIYTKQDEKGNVIELLEDIIKHGREAIDVMITIGGVAVIMKRLEDDIKEGYEVSDKIQADIQQAKDEILSVRGNREVIVKSSDWVLNGDVYEKEITHDLNSENLHVTAKNSDTKEACTIGYKILDKTRILLKSDEAINMSIILSASYYHATQTISDDIAEEVVKARKGETGLDVKITKINEELTGNTNEINALKPKIDNINEQLDNIKNELIKNEFYIPRHKNLIRLYNNMDKFKGLITGDSIMAGAGSSSFNARFDWQLATYLQANIHSNTVSDYLPLNVAVGGTPINQIIHSLGVMVDKNGVPVKSGISTAPYWLIGTGRNDVTNKDVNSFCKKLREVCSQANKLKVDLFIVTAPPKFSNCNVVDGYTGDENYLEIKRNMIRIASEFDVSIIDFHSYMMNRLKTESIRNLYYSDDVHLNDNGQLLLANLVGECMLHESFSDSFNSNFDGDNGRYIMTYLEPNYVNGAIKETLESIPENMVLAHTGIKAAYKIPAGSSVAFPVPQFLNDSTIYIGTLSQLTTGKYNVTSWTTGNIALNQATPQQHNSQYEYVNCIRTIPNVIQGDIQIEAVDGDVYLTGITCISSKLTYKSLTDGFALSGDWKKAYLGVEKQYYKSSTIGNSFSFEFFGTGFSLNLPTDSTGCVCNILIDDEISIDKSLVTASAGVNNETTVGNLKQGYHKVVISIKSSGSNGGTDCYIGEWLKVFNNYQSGEYIKSYTSVDVYNELLNYSFIEDSYTNEDHYITFSGTKLINMINI